MIQFIIAGAVIGAGAGFLFKKGNGKSEKAIEQARDTIQKHLENENEKLDAELETDNTQNPDGDNDTSIISDSSDNGDISPDTQKQTKEADGDENG